MGTIEKELIAAIKSEAERLQNDPKVKEFEKAISDFKTLVEAGIAKERGYNLMTLDATHLQGEHFNRTPLKNDI